MCMDSWTSWKKIVAPFCRASDRSRKKKSNFTGFLGTNSRKNGRFRENLAGVFRANFTKKQSVKTAVFVVIFKANFARNPSVTSIFNVFLTEVIICSFNNNTLQKWTNGKAFTSWLVPSFLYVLKRNSPLYLQTVLIWPGVPHQET